MDQFPTSRVALLVDPPFVLWLLVIAYFLGKRILGLFVREGAASRGESRIFSLLLGLGTLEFVPYALGMSAQLTQKNLWLATGLLSVYAGVEIALTRRNARPKHAAIEPSVEGSREGSRDLFVYGAIVAIALLFSIVLGVAPPSDPDGLFYHLTAPKRWLQSGDLRYLPSLVHTNGPMGGQMLFTWVLGIWSDTSPKLIHFSFGVITLFTIVSLGTRLASRRIGVIAAAVWFLGLNFLGTLGATSLFSVAYVDLNLAAFSLGSVLALLGYLRTRDFGFALVSALCAGLALTTKLTGLFVGGSLTAFLAATCVARKESWSQAFGKTVLFGCVALLPAVPWFMRSWVQTGSPIYLMLPSVFETRDWSPSAGRAFGDFFKYYVWGTGYSSRDWSLEFRKAIRLAALLFVLLTGAVALWRTKSIERRLPLFVFVGVALISIVGTGLYLRYLVPFSGLLLVAILASIPERFFMHRAAQGALVLLLLGNLGLFFKQAFPRPLDAVRVSLGLMSRQEFRQMAFGPADDLWNEVNRRAGKDDQVLLAAGRPAYYVDPYCTITEAYYQERLRMDTWDHYVRDARRDNFVYAIVPLKATLSNPVGPTYPAAENEIPFARRLASEFGAKVGTFGDDELYKLDLSLAAP